MAIQFIQGFEHIVAYDDLDTAMSASEFSRFTGFNTPIHTSNWFEGASGSLGADSGPKISDTVYNIDGQSLAILREDAGGTENPDWNGMYCLNLTKSFTSTTKCVVGFAVYYSAQPTSAIPLVSFHYDDGTEDLEQCSVYLGPTGAIFVGDEDVETSGLTEQTITPDLAAHTGAGAFNFDRFNYIEITLDYSSISPAVSVAVNGISIVYNGAAEYVKKAGDSYITSVTVWNPQNWHFPGEEFIQYIDDYYYSTGTQSAYGPQHMILLEPDDTSSSNWVIEGAEITVHETLDGKFDPADTTDYVYNDDDDDAFILTLEDLPANVVEVTSVALSMFARVDTGTGLLSLQQIEGVDTVAGDVAIDDVQPSYYQLVQNAAPDGSEWDVTLTDALSIGVEVTS